MKIEIPNYSDLFRFCKLIINNDLTDVRSFDKLFSFESTGFKTTLHFFSDIGLVKTNQNKISLDQNFIRTLDLLQGELSYNIPFKQYILRHIITADQSNYNNLLLSLLDEFQFQGSTFTKKVSIALPLYKKKFIDLLVELNFLSVINKIYIVENKFPELAQYINNKMGLSQDGLIKILEEKDEIGKLAEDQILSYELDRLANLKYNDLDIGIVGRDNVNLGYDIKSYDEYNKQLIDIYIEVKAVSIDDYKFYWSRNEKETAKQFTDKYYLYLLPVISKNKFDIDALKVIKDPYNYFKQNKSWEKAVELESYSK